MGSPVRLGDLTRKLRHFGGDVVDRTKHKMAVRHAGGVKLRKVFATKQGRWVDDVYIPVIRKALQLTPEHGVSDEEWDRA